MNLKTILVEKMDGIAVVSLNRPDKLNSINREMRTEIREALGLLRTKSDIRVVIVTGCGRAFCAGADISELGAEPSSDKSGKVKGSMDLVKEIYDFEKPVIGAINGIAAGDGAQWALAFDINIASENAFFAWPATRLGLL